MPDTHGHYTLHFVAKIFLTNKTASTKNSSQEISSYQIKNSCLDNGERLKISKFT